MRLKSVQPGARDNAAGARAKPAAQSVPEPQAAVSALHTLQRKHGNRFVQQFLRSGAIQTKLTVNQPGDSYEQEADRVSEQLMRMPEPRVQRACSCGGECHKCQTQQPGREPERLQTKRVRASDNGQDVAPPIVHEALQSSGHPLDATAASLFGARFGHDFRRVRVHTDGVAPRSAEALNALAYTVGQDIVFAPGQYAPGTAGGRRLLAHELAHVVQQSRPESLAQGPHVQRACLSPQECESKEGTATQMGEDVAEAEESTRAELRQRTPQQVRTALHGKSAVEAEKLFAKELPALRPLVHGVFIDEGMVSSHTANKHVGAAIEGCKAWANKNLPSGTPTPQFEGAQQRCIFISKSYEEEVKQFNETSDEKIGNLSRAEWRIDFLARFTHEVTHERLVAKILRGAFPEVRFPHPPDEDQDCVLATANDTPIGLAREIGELAAQISEFTVYRRTTDPKSSERLVNWFKLKLTSQGESIPGTIRAIRCFCACADADGFIRAAFELATKTWTEEEKTEFHAQMKRGIGTDYGVYWPFELPPREGRVGRHELTFGAGAGFAGSNKLLVAIATYRFVLSQWSEGRWRLTLGAQGIASTPPDKVFETAPRGELGALIGLQYIQTPRSTEKRFGGVTGRVETGFGVGQFSLKPVTPDEPASRTTSADYILQVSGGLQFYLRGLTDLTPLSLELVYRRADPIGSDAETVHQFGLTFTFHR